MARWSRYLGTRTTRDVHNSAHPVCSASFSFASLSFFNVTERFLHMVFRSISVSLERPVSLGFAFYPVPQPFSLRVCRPICVCFFFPKNCSSTVAQVSTDIIHFLSKKLHYYKGDYDTFVNVRTELAKNQRRAYEASAAKKAHMQEFIDKFRSNAKRASLVQSRIKVRFGAGGRACATARHGAVRCGARCVDFFSCVAHAMQH